MKRRMGKYERQHELVKLLPLRLSVGEMAKRLKVTSSTISNDLSILIKQWQSEHVEQIAVYVKQDLELIDSGLRALLDPVTKGDHRAIESACKLMTQRMKLLGLEAPTKQETTATHTFTIAKPATVEMSDRIQITPPDDDIVEEAEDGASNDRA